MLADLLAAARLLTRVPLGPAIQAPTSAAIWAYPVVGAAVGAVAAAVYAVARLGLPSTLASILALAASVALTGALHEDGLADTADALGGTTRARKLEIMRDSRIGTFGALALILSVALRGGTLATLDASWTVALTLVVAHAVGRAAMTLMLVALPPARADGMAANLLPPTPMRFAAALAIAAGIAFALTPPFAALAMLAAAAFATAAMIALARAQVGGHTGDLLGTTEQVAECAILLAAVVTLPH